MSAENELPNSPQSDEVSLDDLGKQILEQEAGIANLPPEAAEAVTKTVKLNKQLYERLKKNQTQPNTPAVPPATPKGEELKLSELSTREVLELRSEGYSDAEILELHEQASRFNTPISKLKDNPLIKEGMEAMRRKAKAEKGTPSSSSRSVGINLKGKPYGELKTDAERREAFNARIGAKTRSETE